MNHSSTLQSEPQKVAQTESHALETALIGSTAPTTFIRGWNAGRDWKEQDMKRDNVHLHENNAELFREALEVTDAWENTKDAFPGYVHRALENQMAKLSAVLAKHKTQKGAGA
jgi:hypothetical protein